MHFNHYHFHIYFESHQLDTVNAVISKMRDLNNIQIGRVWEKPLGPHPTGSCQITVQHGDFEKMLSWFLLERNGLDIFIHPLSGDVIKDHTDYAMWVGNQHTLNLSVFR